jgi:S1-C subfamily serine protease
VFSQACAAMRPSIYGLMSVSPLGPTQAVATTGTAFMIAPGVLITAAHLLHAEGDVTRPLHTLFEAISGPDIGQKMERATLIAEDAQRDTALLRLDDARSASSVTLETSRIAIGTSCGSLGFPLAAIVSSATGPSLSLAERFQGASISAYHAHPNHTGLRLDYYETDHAMYSGSSGCPGFLTAGKVFGMHVASVVVQGMATERLPSTNGGAPVDRLSISIWVAAGEIAAFANANGYDLRV